jgi:hypothetical protein
MEMNIMAMQDFEFFLKNAEAYESLTVDQVHALGRGESIEYGDTAPADPEVEHAAAESDVTPAVAAETQPEPEPELLAKDGKHTIPYSELETARARAEQAEALAATQAELIESLKAAKVADAGTGDTEAQDDVLAEFKEQYPELATMLAPALQKLIDNGVALKTSEIEKKFSEALAPIQKTAQDNSIDAHFSAITDKVPDFDKLVESGAVDKWIETLPSYARAGATRVMNEGTAPEVIELFGQYKATLAAPAPGKTDAEIKDAAAAAIAKAKGGRPTSLTDVPAAQVGTVPEEPTTAEGWSRKFAGMTPEAIMKML